MGQTLGPLVPVLLEIGAPLSGCLLYTSLGYEYTAVPLTDSDWAYSWQKYYTPLEIGQRLYVVPEWMREEPVPQGRVPFYLNQMCIRDRLQLGVTMDYSIFLYHRYEDERTNYEDKRDSMAQAIMAAFRRCV